MYKIFKISIIFFVLCTFLLKVNIIYAIEDPLAVSNNRFGIHIFAENDLLDAVTLVNSSGGDWGYVTFVIREDERDKSRWQRVFNNLRLLHLIPIIRIASSQEEYGWKELDVDDIKIGYLF